MMLFNESVVFVIQSELWGISLIIGFVYSRLPPHILFDGLFLLSSSCFSSSVFFSLSWFRFFVSDEWEEALGVIFLCSQSNLSRSILLVFSIQLLQLCVWQRTEQRSHFLNKGQENMIILLSSPSFSSVETLFFCDLTHKNLQFWEVKFGIFAFSDDLNNHQNDYSLLSITKTIN